MKKSKLINLFDMIFVKIINSINVNCFLFPYNK